MALRLFEHPLSPYARKVKLVLYDSRENSPTRGEVQEFFIGVHNPTLVVVPPLIYHGFKCVGETEALVLNCPTEPYNREQPDEFRLPPDSPDVPYNWARVDR